MKSTSILLSVIVLVFVSCQKENKNSSSQDIPEQTITNMSYGDDAAQKMDIYLPAGRTSDTTKMIVLIHGGAWIEGDKSDFNSYVPILKQRLPGYAIANINYRLASVAANHFPAQENDMKSALDFLVQKSSEYHISQKFVLLGASAGAHMALLQAYKYSFPKIKTVVNFFGPTDMVSLYNSSDPTIQNIFQILLDGTPVSNPSLYEQSGPVNFVDAQDPPTIIFHGEDDMLVNVAESTSFKNKLQTVGIANQLTVYPGLGHEIWPSSTMNDAFDKIAAFVKANVQ